MVAYVSAVGIEPVDSNVIYMNQMQNKAIVNFILGKYIPFRIIETTGSSLNSSIYVAYDHKKEKRKKISSFKYLFLSNLSKGVLPRFYGRHYVVGH